MIGGRQMADVEIHEAFQEAIASGRARLDVKLFAISWMDRTRTSYVLEASTPMLGESHSTARLA
jgi:hypothetical protein